MPINFLNPAGAKQAPKQGPAPSGGASAPPQPQGPQMPQDPGISFNTANMGRNPAAPYQAELDRLSTELRNAQMQGAPPAVIADLQAQLSGAQRNMQQAGMQYAYGRQKNKPQYGGSVGKAGRGGALSPSQQKGGRDYDAFTQMMMSMFGMGGGRGYGGGTPPRDDGW